jgi:hypothetical protein
MGAVGICRRNQAERVPNWRLDMPNQSDFAMATSAALNFELNITLRFQDLSIAFSRHVHMNGTLLMYPYIEQYSVPR